MRKTQKMLAFVLTAAMLLSCIGTMGVSAAVYPETNSFFCDFEDFEIAGFTTMDATDFTSKGFSYAGNSTGATSGAGHFSIKQDITQGKYLAVADGKGIGLDVSLPTTITSGIAKLSFSYRRASSTKLPSVLAMETKLTNAGWKESAAPTQPRLGGFDGNNAYVSIGYGGLSKQKTKTITANQWYRVDMLFDVTNNRWAMYLDGTQLGSWQEGVVDGEIRSGITKLGVLRFFNNTGVSDVAADAAEGYALDDITLTVYEDNNAVDVIGASIDEESKTVSVVLDEDLESTVSASDISMALCGDADTAVVINTVSQLNNSVKFTYTGDLLPGREYEIKLSGCGASGFVNAAVAETRIDLVPLQDFENLTTATLYKTTDTSQSNPYTDRVLDEVAASILQTIDTTNPPASPYNTFNSRSGLQEVAVTPTAGNNASGKAIRTESSVKYNFLAPVTQRSGLITYEFDAKKYQGASALALLDSTGECGIYLPVSNDWAHYKIEVLYHTDNEGNPVCTFTPYRGEELQSQYKATIPAASWTGKLTTNTALSGTTASLYIDNYVCYTVATPFAVKKVRYVDNTGKKTGSSTIAPETTKIEVTFTEPVDDATISNIVLKEGNVTVTPDNIALSADGLTAVLTISKMLCGNSDYTLTIPTSVKADGGNTLSGEIVYVFETTEGKFEISNFEASGSDLAGGTTAGGTLTLSADVLNTEGGEKSFVLLYAYYNDDELVDVDKAEVTIPDGTYYKEISAPFTIVSGTAYDEVKIFIWDSLKNAKPYLPAVKYPQ